MPFPLLLTTYTVEEVAISLFAPDMAVVAESHRKGEIPFPYWAQVWPAAVALSQFIIRHPHYTQDKGVLELGAGLGLPSMVAARCAAAVLASDYAEEAVHAMRQTVMHNHLHNIQVRLLNWTALPPDLTTDVLLLSDVSYDASLFSIQEKLMRQFLAAGTTILLSTPQRLVAKQAIIPLLPFCIHQEEMVVLHGSKEVMVTVLVLQYDNVLHPQ
jgi:predicted nicotinamide N-methyase